ncbi:MAG: TGS domain-containing protein, partial [Candidatus Nanoarchaeia archaeon]
HYKEKLLEVQIRTEEMHALAEEGIASHWRYKGTERDKQFDQKIAWLKQIMEWMRKSKNALDFVEELKIDLFENEVIVFTPKGDPISLPEGATPVDFAFEVHTNIGNHCVRARVNEKIVPLDFELNSGDIVEILVQNNAKPSRNWLNFVKTRKAKNKIKTALGIEIEHKPKEARLRLERAAQSSINLEEHVEVSGHPGWSRNLKVSKCCLPKPGEGIIGVKTKEGKITIHKPDCIHLDSIDDAKKIALGWKKKEVDLFKLRTSISDRPGVMVDILNLLAKEMLTVRSVNTRTRKNRIVLSFKIQMIPEEKRDELVEKVRKINDVNDVRIALGA